MPPSTTIAQRTSLIMPVLLLNSRFTDDSQKLWRSCIGTDWKVERVHGWKIPSLPPGPLALYGEPLFGAHVAQTVGLTLLQPPIDWLPQLPIQWSGRRVEAMTLAEARTVARRSFIKPADEKCFEARIYTSGADLFSAVPGAPPEDLPVLVQDVVEWIVEYRCFVLDGKVRTLSPYWRNGATAETVDGAWPASDPEIQEARECCEAVAAAAASFTPRAVVIDVGVIKDHGWAAIESNAAWAAGIYGCEPSQVLEVVQESCLRR